MKWGSRLLDRVRERLCFIFNWLKKGEEMEQCVQKSDIIFSVTTMKHEQKKAGASQNRHKQQRPVKQTLKMSIWRSLNLLIIIWLTRTMSQRMRRMDLEAGCCWRPRRLRSPFLLTTMSCQSALCCPPPPTDPSQWQYRSLVNIIPD